MVKRNCWAFYIVNTILCIKMKVWCLQYMRNQNSLLSRVGCLFFFFFQSVLSLIAINGFSFRFYPWYEFCYNLDFCIFLHSSVFISLRNRGIQDTLLHFLKFWFPLLSGLQPLLNYYSYIVWVCACYRFVLEFLFPWLYFLDTPMHISLLVFSSLS